MTTPTWQLQDPISAVVFDCDGTLSAIEGIDELAKANGASAEVSALTAEAMGKSGITPSLYQKRLQLVQPKQQHVHALGLAYFEKKVPDAVNIIQLLRHLGKTVYLVSAGLDPAVKLFGELIGIHREHIFAVGIEFDADGNYLQFDRHSPLVESNGKRAIITAIKQQHAHIAYVGDGLNDYAVYDLVTRFIGYGGIFYRQQIEDRCDYYIKTPSLTPLLPLALTKTESDQLNSNELALYQQGVTAIHQGKVKV
jgi:phosphoserine phosphatase